MTCLSNPQTAAPIAALCCDETFTYVPSALTLRQRSKRSSFGSSKEALEHSAGADPVMLLCPSRHWQLAILIDVDTFPSAPSVFFGSLLINCYNRTLSAKVSGDTSCTRCLFCCCPGRCITSVGRQHMGAKSVLWQMAQPAPMYLCATTRPPAP